MRKGRRKLLAILGMVLLGTVVQAAPPEPFPGGDGRAVRIAVEVTWAVRGGVSDAPTTLELTEGRVVEVE